MIVIDFLQWYQGAESKLELGTTTADSLCPLADDWKISETTGCLNDSNSECLKSMATWQLENIKEKN